MALSSSRPTTTCGSGADHREREQQDREGLGDAGGRALVLGGEEEEGRETDLEHPVAGLAHQADREELAEVAKSQEFPQLPDHLHAGQRSRRSVRRPPGLRWAKEFWRTRTRRQCHIRTGRTPRNERRVRG